MHNPMSAGRKLFTLSMMVLLCVASSLASPQVKGKISGRSAYGIASDSRLSIYAIDETTSDVRILGYVLAPGSGAASLALDPKRPFVYLANNGSNDVAVFGANKENGALTWLSNFQAGTGPSTLPPIPPAHFVYVANQISNDGAPSKSTALGQRRPSPPTRRPGRSRWIDDSQLQAQGHKLNSYRRRRLCPLCEFSMF